jgi:hypothetical protein
MSGSTPGNRQSPGQSDVYWRRRVIALAGAVGVLALIAWTVNGTLGGSGNAQTAADSTHTGQHAKHGIAPAAATSPAVSPGSAAPAAAAAATPRPTASAHGQHGEARHGQTRHGQTRPGQAKHAQAKKGQANNGRHQAGHGTTAGGRAAACPRGSVVLSLFTTTYRYPAHQTPRFQLDVVSTAPRPCSFDLGAKHVQLVIKAGGERQVWDSADCAAAGHRVTRLTRGVPDVLRVTWDRKTAAASCRLGGKAARPGTYTATARSGPVHSQSLIFVLGGPGVAVP